MNARYTAGLLALSAAAAGCAGASGSGAANDYPGASSAPRSLAASVPRPNDPQPEPWERFAEVAGWEPVNSERFVSSGHFGGRHKVEVRVSSEARLPYLSLVPGRELPPGSVVSAFHREARDGGAGPVLAMVKGARDWEYLSLDAQGRVEERGALPLCLRCHAEGVADQLFGLPKS